MDVQAQGSVGEQGRYATGAEQALRLGPYGDLVVQQLHGKYWEQCRLGRVFTLPGTIGGFAGAASHVSPLAAGTGTPIIGLYNPPGNTKIAAILKTVFIVAPVADTAVGLPVWNVFGPVAVPGVTAPGNAVPVNALVGGTLSAMRGFTNSALTGGPVGIFTRHFAPSSAGVAVATATAYTMMVEDTDGSIIVPPGCFAGLALSAAGTTYNITGSLVWEETDWPIV